MVNLRTTQLTFLDGLAFTACLIFLISNWFGNPATIFDYVAGIAVFLYLLFRVMYQLVETARDDK